MTPDLERIWNNNVQKGFLASVDPTQIEALLDLLIVSTFADENVSLEERRGLSLAISQFPEIDESLAIDTHEVAERTERLYARWGDDRSGLMHELVARLGTDTARRHAFRTTVQLLASDGFEKSEEAFVQELGDTIGMEETVVNFAIRDASGA